MDRLAAGGFDAISIHAPVKGATKTRDNTVQRTRHFNPRTREGCDTKITIRYRPGIDISIHAPVKGATFFLPCLAPHLIYFNPRTREGCDKDALGHPIWARIISIHAPVKGATWTEKRSSSDFSGFQSTHP